MASLKVGEERACRGAGDSVGGQGDDRSSRGREPNGTESGGERDAGKRGDMKIKAFRTRTK